LAKNEPYAVEIAPIVDKHLDFIDVKYHSMIHKKIAEQLTYDPDVKTRNRKPVRTPAAFQAEWELRFGPDNRFRVFYQIKQEIGQVRVVAIGEKNRNRLYVAGEEMTL
jgi:mRNA-degrading endonuclease RelE of RelBE toxin-antitoxin system